MIIRPLMPTDVKGGFSCGVAALDSYFAKHAYNNHHAGISQCYVAVDTPQPETVVGYYTLAAKSVDGGLLGPYVPVKPLPKYPLPVIYLGWFAVGTTFQGHGVGTRMLAEAMDTCAEAIEKIGAVGVFLEAYDEKVRIFYRNLGFVDLALTGPAPYPMILPRATLQKAT